MKPVLNRMYVADDKWKRDQEWNILAKGNKNSIPQKKLVRAYK